MKLVKLLRKAKGILLEKETTKTAEIGAETLFKNCDFKTRCCAKYGFHFHLLTRNKL